MQDPGYQSPSYSTPIPSPTEYSAPTGMRTVRSIGISSAFKMGAVLSALMFLVFGFFLILLPSLFGASLIGALASRGGAPGAGAMGAGGIIIYIFGTIFYGIFGGIFGAVYALLYNLVASWAGGIEIELA